MGILERFSTIMKAEVNSLLDKCEDPAKLVDQMLVDARENLAKVKSETAGVMAAETEARGLVEKCKKDIARYTTAATNAIKSGNDGDARKLLEKKQALETQLTGLEANYKAASESAQNMIAMHDKLVADIDTLEGRKTVIKAKLATAKAQESVNKATAGMSSAGSMEAFERMEKRATDKLNRAQAEAQLNKGASETADLVSKYEGGPTSSVDDELARMKAELGLSGDGQQD